MENVALTVLTEKFWSRTKAGNGIEKVELRTLGETVTF
jgi:hypothetical protein